MAFVLGKEISEFVGNRKDLLKHCGCEKQFLVICETVFFSQNS